MNATWLGQTLADWNLHLARLNQPLRFGNQAISRTKTNTAWLGQNVISILQSALGAVGINLSSYELWEEIATTEVGDIINGWNATVAPVAQNLPTGYLTWSDVSILLSRLVYRTGNASEKKKKKFRKPVHGIPTLFSQHIY